MIRKIKIGKKPRASIVIAYDKDRGYLDEAIESARKQDFEDYEIVLSQGEYLRGVNINNAIEKCSGYWIKLLDEDDLLPSNCLKDFWANRRNFDWLCANALNFGKYVYFDQRDDDVVFKSRVITFDEMLEKNRMHGGTTFYKKRLFEETGGFDETLWTAEEYDFHLLLLQKGYKLGYVDSVVYKYRMQGQNKSTQNNQRERNILKNKIIQRYK